LIFRNVEGAALSRIAAMSDFLAELSWTGQASGFRRRGNRSVRIVRPLPP
jgi:hypothetical protein